jgi:hypothetical protein
VAWGPVVPACPRRLTDRSYLMFGTEIVDDTPEPQPSGDLQGRAYMGSQSLTCLTMDRICQLHGPA